LAAAYGTEQGNLPAVKADPSWIEQNTAHSSDGTYNGADIILNLSGPHLSRTGGQRENRKFSGKINFPVDCVKTFADELIEIIAVCQ
jgi:hypothetical protein